MRAIRLLRKAFLAIRETMHRLNRSREQERIREAIANGASQYQMQTFDQSLFALLQSRRISFEEAVHNATNPDEFKMRVSGILSTEQALDVEGRDKAAHKTDQPESKRDEFESAFVKH